MYVLVNFGFKLNISFCIPGQIEHKYAFIEKAGLPPDVRMTLIGHSMGSYVILRLMKKLKMESNVEASAAYFLFPMIERMAETPNGSSFFFQHVSLIISYEMLLL